jgi:hypothetical protein
LGILSLDHLNAHANFFAFFRCKHKQPFVANVTALSSHESVYVPPHRLADISITQRPTHKQELKENTDEYTNFAVDK